MDVIERSREAGKVGQRGCGRESEIAGRSGDLLFLLIGLF